MQYSYAVYQWLIIHHGKDEQALERKYDMNAQFFQHKHIRVIMGLFWPEEKRIAKSCSKIWQDMLHTDDIIQWLICGHEAG